MLEFRLLHAYHLTSIGIRQEMEFIRPMVEERFARMEGIVGRLG